jgi:hypothetical protein
VDNYFQTICWSVTDFPSSKNAFSQIAAIVAMSILIFLTVLLNLVATVTILKSHQLKNKLCYYLILIQSVVDLGIGSLGKPLIIYHLVTPSVAFQHCAVSIGALKVGFLLTSVSIFTSCAIAFERDIGVLHPYKYGTLLTKTRIKIYLLFGVV